MYSLSPPCTLHRQRLEEARVVIGAARQRTKHVRRGESHPADRNFCEAILRSRMGCVWRRAWWRCVGHSMSCVCGMPAPAPQPLPGQGSLLSLPRQARRNLLCPGVDDVSACLSVLVFLNPPTPSLLASWQEYMSAAGGVVSRTARLPCTASPRPRLPSMHSRFVAFLGSLILRLLRDSCAVLSSFSYSHHPALPSLPPTHTNR
jgi:hypothetical protein